MRTNRRKFIQTSFAAGVALPGFPYVRAQSAQKFRVALIGTGWWGMNILRTGMESGECKVVAMADVDQNQLQPALQEVEKLSRSEEHTSELQSPCNLVCRLLLEKKKTIQTDLVPHITQNRRE